MQTKSMYLVFDLDFNSDYHNLYVWLDEHNAKECGDFVAVIKEYRYEGDFIEYLKEDLLKSVNFTNKCRVYVIYSEEGKMKGRFILGGRKRPQWEGYAKYETEDVDIEIVEE